jgi:hypothetical protein
MCRVITSVLDIRMIRLAFCAPKMVTKTHTVQSTRLSESISLLETRLLELQNKYDARHAELKIAEAVSLKNLEESANKQTANAIDRIVKVVDFARNMLLALIVIATVLGVGGYFQVQSFVKDFVTTQVKSWLNIAEPSSPLHDPISTLTTRVAIDALIMDRARYGTRASYMGNMKISAMWIDKMLADLANPITSEGDFADLALALSTEAPVTGGGDHRLLIVHTVRKLLLDPKVPTHRKATLLRTFGFDPALREVALSMYVNGKDIDTQAAAFRYLRKSLSPERLVDLARPIITHSSSDASEDFMLLQQQAAEALAEAIPWDKDLANYLVSKDRAGNYLERALIGLAMLDGISTNSSFSVQQMSDTEKTRRIALAAPLLAAAIDAGANVTWSSAAAGKPIIALQRSDKGTTYYHTISTPRSLLAPALGDAVLTKLGRNMSGLSKLVSAVSGAPNANEEFGRPYRVQLTLKSNDQLETTTGDILTEQRLGHPLYLEGDAGARDAILIRWRDIDGLYKISFLRQVKLTTSEVKIVPASPESDRYLENYRYNSYFD